MRQPVPVAVIQHTNVGGTQAQFFTWWPRPADIYRRMRLLQDRPLWGVGDAAAGMRGSVLCQRF
jgi:hypothetical protein